VTVFPGIEDDREESQPCQREEKSRTANTAEEKKTQRAELSATQRTANGENVTKYSWRNARANDQS
jgi:hypothetical protein